jgi:3'(2'), 5'-bisphosphate nucleotidase
LDLIAEKMGVQAEPVRLDSQAKYAILASGAGDLIFRLISPNMPDYKEKIWDQAAGSLVVEEAGGKITDLDGKLLDFTKGRTLAGNRGVLASNALLHNAALEAIQNVGA